MASLTTCMKKAGTHLRKEDKDAVMKAAQQLRKDGVSADDAALQAVQGQIDAVGAALKKLEGDVKRAKNPAKAKAYDEAMAAIGDIGDALSKNYRMYMMPEQEQKLMPALVRLLDAAFRLGYHSFKDAAKFALDKIRDVLGDDAADAIKLSHLKGAYIGMSGSNPGADSDDVVVQVKAKSEIENHIAQEQDDVPDTDADMERDSPEPTSERTVGDTVSPDAGGTTEGTGGTGGQTSGEDGGGQQDGGGLRTGGSVVAGKQGDISLLGEDKQDGLEGFDAGFDFSEPSGDFGFDGVPNDPIPASKVTAVARDATTEARKRREQKDAGKLKVKRGDQANIRETLPYLLSGQQEDVFKAETVFARPTGYGMLFTNGTGTGKTFTGMGLIKRFAMQGKGNILVVVPDDKIASDWINSGRALDLTLTQLEDTKSAGTGIVVTTYANLGANDALAKRQWDLVVSDEAHTLMQSADGTVTSYLQNLRAITHHPDGAEQRFKMQNRPDIERLDALQVEIRTNHAKIDANPPGSQVGLEIRNKDLKAQRDTLQKKLRQAKDAVHDEVADMQGEKRVRVTFLSATPFAYEKTVDWANGYLFDYNEGYPYANDNGPYNRPSPQQYFMMNRFGYTMKYNKLTAPGANVDSGLLQRKFNTDLKKSGVVSGRVLDVDFDYDRRFVLVDSAIGNRIDEALQWLDDQVREESKGNINNPKEAKHGMGNVRGIIGEQFDYLSRRYLLEAIKAKEAVEIVREHLAMGRKVVVFHDYNKGGSTNPFAIEERRVPPLPANANAMERQNMLIDAKKANEFNEALRQFKAKFPELLSALDNLKSPIEVFKQELPQTLLINGREKQKDLLARYEAFQDDANGPQVMLVQSDKNKGWSGHDTTGRHQRVLINLGQPTAPTKAIQQEGRIYRTGQASDAIFRYLNTGTNWERWAFATTIAARASAAENLSMGEEARALKDAFIQAFEESNAYSPGHEGEGTGGKERDRMSNAVITEYDRAKTLYFANGKKTAQTKSAEGVDYFATPEPVGLKMVQWLDAKSGEQLLEPSAGHGAIARWLPEGTQKTVIEPSAALRARLALSMNMDDTKVIPDTFEELHKVNKFDGIVMNPPFGRGGDTAMEHLAKAATHLRDGGRIVALLPAGPAADKRLEKFMDGEDKPLAVVKVNGVATPINIGDTIVSSEQWAPESKVTGWSSGKPIVISLDPMFSEMESAIDPGNIKEVKPTGKATKTGNGLNVVANIMLPTVTFERAGTKVATRIVVFEKGGKAEQQDFDLSGITEVGKLFDALENMALPERTNPAPVVAGKNAPRQERKEEAAPVLVKRGETVTLDGKPYTVTTYQTNGGNVLTGVWVPSRDIALKYATSTFQKKPFGWFVREQAFPKNKVQEPEATYNDRYENDMLGNPVPSPSRKPAGKGRAGTANTYPNTALPDTKAPAGKYHYRTIIGSETQRTLGATRIVLPQDLARATSYLYSSAVERFDGVVTDRKGKPLAVVGGFKGALTQTSVYPSTLVGEAIRIPGASSIWFSHNHPSGSSTLSEADHNLALTLTKVFEGSGIDPRGLMAISNGRFSFTDSQSEWINDVAFEQGTEQLKVPVMERQLARSEPGDNASSPEAAMVLAKRYYQHAKGPGLMLLDAQLRVAAWVPISEQMTGKLRYTGGLNAVYRAISEGNARSAIIVHGGELDGSITLENGRSTEISISQNIAAALQLVDVQALDSINAVTGKSASKSLTENIADGPVFARGGRTDFQDRVVAAQDLASLVRSTGQRLKVRSDGYVILYHSTSNKYAESINKSGIFKGNTWFSASKSATMEHARPKHGSNTETLEIPVDPRTIEFSTGTGEFYAPNGLYRDANGYWSGTDPANPDIRMARQLTADSSSTKIAPRRAGMQQEVAQQIVDEMAGKWTNGPEIVVVSSTSDLPIEVPPDVRGMMYQGVAYVVAGSHTTAADVRSTLAHEVIGHYGLWKILGTDGQRKFVNNVKMALASGNKPLNALAAHVRASYVDDNGNFNLSEVRYADEIAARAVETALDADGNFKPGYSFLKEVWAKVADFLRSMGFTVKFTNAELQGLLVASMKGLEAGQRMEGMPKNAKPAFVRAWHGSPHVGIEKFSTDKIGTGEGAQAYGWGLYFGSHKEIAEHYRNYLKQRALILDMGRNNWRVVDPLGNVLGDGLSMMSKALEVKEKYDAKAGALYEVDIPAEDEFLLWDKHMVEQPEKVRSALKGNEAAYRPDGTPRNMKGDDLYEVLIQEHGSDRAASEYLASLGIKGIKYQDGVSNWADKGSHNYVVFRGDDVEVVAAYARGGNTYDGYQSEDLPPLQATRKIKRIVAKLDAGKLTPENFEYMVRQLAGWMDEVATEKRAKRNVGERERGADIVREKLLAARRRGEIEFEAAEFALWALAQNPAMADDLAITVQRPPASKKGSSGDYNPAAKLMRVFKGGTNENTATHEILHHTERMMPGDVQKGIQEAWAKAYAKALADAAPKQRAALELMLEAMAGDILAANAVMKAFMDGTLKYREHYQLTNPSEFWAVNATRILRSRYDAGSWIANARQWLGEMLQKVKGLLGLRSDAPVLRGLNAVLNADGEFKSKKMLSDGDVFGDLNDQTETPAFKAWFGDSKMVDAEGKPLVAYHGTVADIAAFWSKFAGSNTPNSGMYGRGAGYFTNSSDIANAYAQGNPERTVYGKGQAAPTFVETPGGKLKEGANVMPVFISIKNPLEVKSHSELDAFIRKIAGSGKLGALSVTAALKALGYDGVIVDGGKEIVPFSPEQIKSAIGNNGNFDPSNADIAFARGQRPAGPRPASFSWSAAGPSILDNGKYEFTDDRVDLEMVQKAITESGQVIDEQFDARLAETLYPGRVDTRSKQFLKVEVKPLLEAMAAYKVPMHELADYLHARGAPERNAQIAKVNDAKPGDPMWDGGAGKNSQGVLMTNLAAQAHIAAITPARKQVLDALAKRVDAITKGTRDLLVAKGLEKQETIDAWESAYKNYVPMFRDEAESGAPHPQGSGFNVRGGSSRRATGSHKAVTNIIAHVLMQREAAITRAEKNRVALSLYGLALSFPNPDFWTTIKPGMSNKRIVAELRAMGVDPATAATGMDLVPTITDIDPVTNKVRTRPNPFYKNLPGAITLRVDGEDRVLMLSSDNPRGARLAASLKNMDGFTNLDLASTMMGKATRFLAAVRTQWNPSFGPVNLVRDALGGAVNSGSTEVRGKGLALLLDLTPAVVGIARELVKPGQGGKWQTLFRQFMMDGGKTGYMQTFRDPNDRAKEIERDLIDFENKGKLLHVPGRVAGMVLELVTHYNDAFENAIRLSAYSKALEKGLSRAEAARIGRELTVDFNRKGRTIREIGPVFAFLSPSIGGNVRTIKTLTGPTGRMVIAGGLGLGVLQALMLLLAGYDDDEVSEYTKLRSLVIPMNWSGKEKNHVLIPLPPGLNVIPNTGRVIAELVLNGGKDWGSHVGSALSEIATSFNPTGGGNIFTADGALKTVAPTLVDPLVELATNKNFASNPTEREQRGESDKRPGEARARTSTLRQPTGQVYLGISKAVNRLTGGDEYEAGLVSPTPERVRYIAQTVGGGLLLDIERTANAVINASNGVDVKPKDLPVVGRFYGEVDPQRVASDRYFANTKKIEELTSVVKAMEKAGDFAAAGEFREQHPELFSKDSYNDAKRAITALNKREVSNVGNVAELEQIDKERMAAQNRLNESVKQKQKPALADGLRKAAGLR